MRRTGRAALTAGFLLLAGLAIQGLAEPPRPSAPPTQERDEHAMARSRMIRQIETDTRETAAYLGKVELDARVMAAMETVERHEFVPDGYRERAYVNRPLPIGEGQTISQPFIVALMTDLLDPEPGDRVLEVGTGSGYQAAVLAELVEEVYSIEIVEPLALQAEARLERLGYRNVETRVGDGYAGWPEAAPFDGIVVTAACPHVPRPLVEQLAPGARLVLPLASNRFGEELTVIEKNEDGTTTSRGVLPVRFVPLTGSHGGDP